METFKRQCSEWYSRGCVNICPVWTAREQTNRAEASNSADIRVVTLNAELAQLHLPCSLAFSDRLEGAQP